MDYDRGLKEFLEKAFRKRMPALIDFSLKNQTVAKMLQHLRRHTTGSIATAYQYTYGIWRYHLFVNSQPDAILSECWDKNGDVLPKMIRKHEQLVDDFYGHIQEQGQAPGTIANYVKGVKALYRESRLQLQLPRYPRTVLYPYRSPTPDELRRLLTAANLRERLIVYLLSLTGVRLGTFCKLTYGHVKEDLDRGMVPLLIRIEPAIVKGLYAGYWTFLGPEGVECLKATLAERRMGTGKIPPETLHNESPLIRDSRCATEVRPITPGQVWLTVNQLYQKAGLIEKCPQKHVKRQQCVSCDYPTKSKRRYELRVHSLRYFFRTNLTCAGVNPEYAEFMMGHKGPLYNDVRSKGIEFLRDIYRASVLALSKRRPPADWTC